MVFRSRNLLSCLWIIFLWKIGRIKAYMEGCDFSPMTVYCSCDALAKDSTSYRVTCTIFRDVEETDAVWRSMGDSENISYLKLQPKLPEVILNYIPSDELRRMPNLKMLLVQEFVLGTLKSNAVSDYKNLAELELEGNDIESLERNAISNLPKLKKLALSRNSLQELLENSLSGLLELEILFLDRNNISRIETCAFCNLQNLKELDLWENQISDLTEYTFRGLRYLRKLDLFKNKIRILNDKVFQSMPRLMELELKDNMISHISARAFTGLDKLRTLGLSNNMIKILPDEVFAPLLDARSINLYQNHLEMLQREVVANAKKSKDEHFLLGFRENPYKCDCAMQWVSSYLNATKSHRFKRELEEVRCKLENDTMKILEYLKTTDCKMHVKKPRVSSALITSLITKSTDSVPVELNSQKNKPVVASATAADEGTEETYLSDVSNVKADVDDSGNGSHRLSVDVFIVVCISLMNFILYESRR